MNHPILTVLRIRRKQKKEQIFLITATTRQPTTQIPTRKFRFLAQNREEKKRKKKSKLFSEKRSSMAQSVWRVFTYVCVDRKKQNEKSLNLQSSSRINVNYKCFGLQCWHSASDANTRLPTSCHCKTFRWEFSFSMEHTHTHTLQSPTIIIFVRFNEKKKSHLHNWLIIMESNKETQFVAVLLTRSSALSLPSSNFFFILHTLLSSLIKLALSQALKGTKLLKTKKKNKKKIRRRRSGWNKKLLTSSMENRMDGNSIQNAM